MKFGYTIIYVRDVSKALAFFERAFGLFRRFVHESGYGELCTGETTLAFASHALVEKNLPGGYVAADASSLPLGIEIALITDDVAASHAKAISEGALELTPPVQKPWGQTVSYVQSPDGILIELCTPVAN
ncbi:MAG: 3-dioxygenase [Verrucomicrobia bacterium]|nr:MAG: 3-dioxygenase [Verrucomicrobiota bacterium]